MAPFGHLSSSFAKKLGSPKNSIQNISARVMSSSMRWIVRPIC